MTRVSLKEAYDNKDVVAQIYAIRDIAEGAEDTANNAVSTANTASGHVDALVPQVEGAVQNANNASASAQASAQTVAGYENRLSDVELRVTTTEGDIVTIQGRITALETADGQNVKLSGNQNISGIKTVPTEATGSSSQQIANSAKVSAELDNYEHMLRTTGNQTKAGTLTFSSPAGLDISNDSWRLNLTFPGATKDNTTTAYSGWLRFMAGNPQSSGEIGRIEYDMMDNGHRRIRLFLVSPSGQYVSKTLFEIDETGGVVG